MTWVEKVRFKLRAVHTEMAELRRYIHERGLPEAEAEHLFRGHLRSLDALALDKLPLAVAMDTSDILVRYQGKDAQTGRCSVTKMNRLFTTLHQQVVEMTKSHGQLSSNRFRWTCWSRLARPTSFSDSSCPNQESALATKRIGCCSIHTTPRSRTASISWASWPRPSSMRTPARSSTNSLPRAGDRFS